MPKKPARELKNVKPITFERFMISDDGESVIFELHDKSGNVGHITVKWLNLSIVAQMLGQVAEKAASVRNSLGKTDDFDGSSRLTAQLVSRFQVSELPDNNLKILSLQSPVGFRCDFAIPTDTVDQRGRSYPRAIAEELLAEAIENTQKPN